MTELLPAAVLWDMDGTIVDTESYWFSAEAELVASFGGLWTTEDGLALVGSGLWHTAAIFQDRGVDLSADEIVDRLTDRVMEHIETRVPWRPGAVELLTGVRESGIPCALVTMSISRMAGYVASRLPGTASFDQIVSGDSVTHSKPHPEPYLRGAELLGVDPTECVAIEDSTTGLASAMAAGTVAIGVPLHSPLTEGHGYTIWPTLDGKSVSDLSTLFDSARSSVS